MQPKHAPPLADLGAGGSTPSRRSRIGAVILVVFGIAHLALAGERALDGGTRLQVLAWVAAAAFEFLVAVTVLQPRGGRRRSWLFAAALTMMWTYLILSFLDRSHA